MPYNGIYKTNTQDTFKLSRSKVELYLNCKRCFYLDRKYDIKRPFGFPFNLNNAVDELLKKEFDIYRTKKEPHPYMKDLGFNALPFEHNDLDKWRHNFTGVSFDYKPTNFHLFGAVDDVWVNTDTDELIVVDYKATSKNGEVSLDANWQMSYKRQLEFYQFLLLGSGYKVYDTVYFVYCNGLRNKESFNERLDFSVKIIPYVGNTKWIEPTLKEIYDLLNQDKTPKPSSNCDYCNYLHKRYLQSIK
jgi:hypothetical protein